MSGLLINRIESRLAAAGATGVESSGHRVVFRGMGSVNPWQPLWYVGSSVIEVAPGESATIHYRYGHGLRFAIVAVLAATSLVLTVFEGTPGMVMFGCIAAAYLVEYAVIGAWLRGFTSRLLGDAEAPA